MEVDIEDLNPTVLRKTTFFNAHRLDGTETVFVAEYDAGLGPYRWLVLDPSVEDCNLRLYTTEEMKHCYKSFRDEKGSPISVYNLIARQCLVRAGVFSMMLKDGCPGCRKFWKDLRLGSQCMRCHRCRDCCKRDDVRSSCMNKFLRRKQREQETERDAERD